MSIYINIVCDHKDCKKMQPIEFDKFSETWGDMIDCVKSIGWILDIEKEKVIKATCPDHK